MQQATPSGIEFAREDRQVREVHEGGRQHAQRPNSPLVLGGCVLRRPEVSG
jgi:hypothetical protein